MNATPRAVRALGVSCAATAATAVNTSPEPVSANPKASEPVVGTSVVSRPAMTIRPVSTDAPKTETERRGQAGEPADGRRREKLGAAGLLVGAGVPDDGEDDRDGDQRVEHAGLPDPHGAEAVVVHVAVHGALGRAGHDRRCNHGGSVGDCRVDLLDTSDVDGGRRHGQQKYPQRRDDAVPAHAQPQKAQRPGEGFVDVTVRPGVAR